MKSIAPLILIVVLLSSTLVVIAQDEPPAVDESADANLAALKELRLAYEEACNTSDPAKLKPYLDPDFTGVMVTNQTVASFDDVQEYWDMVQGYLGEGGTYQVSVTLDDDAVFDENYALAYGTTEDVAKTGSGREFKFTSKWTAVCRKNAEGDWKIWRIHGSIDPVDNPFISAMGGATTTITGVIAAIVGLLVGFAVAKMFGGKPSGK